MSSEKAVGAAPLLTGIVLAAQSARAMVRSGLSLRSVPGFVGGCAAIVVGAGILLEWGEFEAETPTERSRATDLALAALAFVGLAAGAGLVLV